MTQSYARRRLYYPGDDYAAWVELPDEWLCEHLVRREGVLLMGAQFPLPPLADLALALVLADGFSVPGIEGADAAAWDLNLVPVPVLLWLTATVLADFNRAFEVPGYLLRAIAEMYDGDAGPQPHGWVFGPDSVTVVPPTMIVQLWLDRRRFGSLPKAGGWNEQPLALMVQMDLLDLVDSTCRHKATPEADWTLFTPLQRDLIGWLEKGADQQ